MRKLISTLAVSLIALSQSLSAQWVEDTSLDVAAGYRRDTLEFRSKFGFDDSSSGSSSSSARGDQVHGTDKFKSLNMWEISIAGRATFCEGIYIRGSADYAGIVDGSLKSSFKFVPGNGSNNASGFVNDTFGIHADSKDGYAYDLSAGIGYEFSLCCDQFKIAPVVGYTYDVQHIKSRHFRLGDLSNSSSSSSSSGSRIIEESSSSSDIIVVSDDSFSSSSSSSNSTSSGIRSNANIRWSGPFLGVDFLYNIDCDWNIFGGFEWHWASQHVKFHTKFDFVDDGLCSDNNNSSSGFSDKATYRTHAWGPWFNLGTSYRFDECWSAGLQGKYIVMEARKGDKDKKQNTKLTHVEWHSFTIEAMVAYHF